VPLSNTQVISTRFEAHHAPVANAVMTATCTVTRQTAATGYDDITGRSTYPAATTVYTGQCRVQRASTRRLIAPEVGERHLPQRPYQVSMPLTAPVLQVDDIIEVTDAIDTDFIGTRMAVTDVMGGSVVWQRDYTAEEWSEITR